MLNVQRSMVWRAKRGNANFCLGSTGYYQKYTADKMSVGPTGRMPVLSLAACALRTWDSI
jgi:hypothetical protein